MFQKPAYFMQIRYSKIYVAIAPFSALQISYFEHSIIFHPFSDEQNTK